MSAILASHEKSEEHLKNVQLWKELELRFQKGKSIINEHIRQITQENYWKSVLERLITLVRELGSQNLAF